MINIVAEKMLKNAEIFHKISYPEINDRFKVIDLLITNGIIIAIIHIENKGCFDLPYSILPKNYEGKTLIIKDIQTFIKERNGVQYPIRKYLVDFAK